MIIDHSMKRVKEMAQMTREQSQFGDILQLTKHNQPQKQKELSNKCPQGKTLSPKENDEQTIP